jgi:hypothetical protein
MAAEREQNVLGEEQDFTQKSFKYSERNPDRYELD